MSKDGSRTPKTPLSRGFGAVPEEGLEPRHADYDSRPSWLSHRGIEAGWTSRWTQPHLRPRRVLRVRALQPRHRPALAPDRSGLRWEQGWEQRGSKSRLRMALAVRSCPLRNPLLCREFSMNTRHTGPLGPPSTEPKVRGSNPLGRAKEGAVVSQIPSRATAAWHRRVGRGGNETRASPAWVTGCTPTQGAGRVVHGFRTCGSLVETPAR